MQKNKNFIIQWNWQFFLSIIVTIVLLILPWTQDFYNSVCLLLNLLTLGYWRITTLAVFSIYKHND